MSTLATTNFGFFFTRGFSLQRWEGMGILEREIKLSQHLAGSFNTVYLFSYGGSIEKRYQSLFPKNVIIVPKPSLMPLFLYSFLLPIIHWKKFRTIGILRTNQMDGSWAAVIAKLLFGARLVIRCGYEWLFTIEKLKKPFFKRWFAHLAERFAYGNADKIILTSEVSAQFVRERFAISSEKITVISNYVDTTLFVPSLEKERGRVIFVGRLEQEKNVDTLIRAMAGIEGKLVIIGDGSLRSDLEKLAQQMNVNVVFQKALPQAILAGELAKSEVFALVSSYEGNPKALIEAFSCGLACIGTNVSGIREIISDGKSGVLCKTDKYSLHDALKYLLMNPSLCDTLGANARKEALETYSFEKILERELLLFKSL